MTDDKEQRISEFRSKVMALLKADWPLRTETDEDTKKLASVLATQLRNWESWN